MVATLVVVASQKLAKKKQTLAMKFGKNELIHSSQ
jgi:hypothetical protein